MRKKGELPKRYRAKVKERKRSRQNQTRKRHSTGTENDMEKGKESKGNEAKDLDPKQMGSMTVTQIPKNPKRIPSLTSILVVGI